MKYTLKIQELVALALGKYYASKIEGHLFSWAPKSRQMVAAGMKLKHACSLEEKL